jgi:hypothetical protein
MIGSDWPSLRSLTFTMILEPVWYVCQALFAVCIFITVFRQRLWNIDHWTS